jgi:hypothetical protein
MTGRNIDAEIKQALADEDAEVYARFAEEPSMLAMGLEILNSRNRLFTIMVVIVMTAFMAIGIYSLWRFSGTQETKALMGWAMTFGFSMMAVSMLKLWGWMEIEKNSTIREIKRLELQVARLTQRLGESQ